MDNAILITLSAQNALMRKMEIAANNMANVSTAGFKAEEALFEPITKRPAKIAENPTTVSFVRDYSIARDFRPGTLTQSGNPFDVALTGDGFFAVKTADGTAYTRDGQFTLDTTGRLVTHDGKPVLDNSNSEITLNVAQGEPLIGKDGNIRQNGASVGQIGVFKFNRPGTLEKIGDNLFKPTSETAAPAETFEVVQGMVEGSNVNAVQQLTDIMEISRAFESATKLQKQAEDLRSKAIDRLAKV